MKSCRSNRKRERDVAWVLLDHASRQFFPNVKRTASPSSSAMPNLSRIPVAIRPALVAAALLSTTTRLPAQNVEVAAASDTPLIPLTTRWPSRTGIAVMAPKMVNAMSIEATSDGWVIVTPLTHWSEERDTPPTMRLHVSPEDVQTWTTAVRRVGAHVADSAASREDFLLPILGRGRVHLAQHASPYRGTLLLPFVTCDGVGTSFDMNPSDLSRFTEALERASDVARRADASPSLPTLARPYYASEVSCAARPLEPSVAPSFPRTIPRAKRRYTEVGVRFIVDTAGFVESGSLAILPGTQAVFAKAALAVARGWHFRPAEFSGLPVRQIVNTVVAFDPADAATRSDPDRILSARRNGPNDPFRFISPRPPFYVLRDGGWVRVAMGQWRANGVFDGFQEWLSPDSVDAWVAHVSRIFAADSAHPKYPRSTFEPGKGPGSPLYPDMASLMMRPRSGNTLTVQYQNGWGSDTQRLKLIALMNGCGGGSVVPSVDIDRQLLDRLTTAARAARRYRKSAPSLERSYQRGEVACPAYLPPTVARQPGLPGVWRHPRAPYPEALSRENVRAEVLTSFEVDTLGVPIAETLEAAPGSDPRAVASLRETIGHVRFNPAARAGSRVKTRVIRTWLFEPPSACASEDDGIDCARMYGRGP